jgi:hypothetical protein
MRTALTAIALGAVVAAAGCGDDGPSKSGFAKSADTICRDGNRALTPISREIEEAGRGSDDAEVYKRMAQITQRSVAVSEQYIAKLDALETPGDDRDKLKSWIADLRRQQTLIGRLSAAFSHRDQTEIVKLSEQIDGLNTSSNRFAASYGMRECAKDS